MSNRAALALILLLFISHLPFLTADPDRDISFSRGPFTDEGLNTIQVRNFINHGYLDFHECDNLLKTPLFAAVIGTPLWLFGTKLTVARLTVLILTMLALYLVFRKSYSPSILWFLVPIAFFKYQAFQFSHFSLAEVLSASSIMVGIFFIARSYAPFRSDKYYLNNSILAAAFISFAYFFKIQFIYIIPLSLLVTIERAIFFKKFSLRTRYLNGAVMSGVTILFLAVYLLAWYLPHKETYDFMMINQSGAFEINSRSGHFIRFNLSNFVFSGGNILYSLGFLLALVTGIFLLFRNASPQFHVLFKSGLGWVALEMHKLTMSYWPTRYQVSFYIAMGLVISVVFIELYRYSSRQEIKRALAVSIRAAVILLSIVLFSANLNDYLASMDRRSYQIREANQYLGRSLEKEDVAIGSWASSLTWDSKCRAMPVWSGFLNDIDPVRSLNPTVIISEPDEQDSEQAYQKQGIDLVSISDSVKNYHISNWDVNIYWVRQDDTP